ncbi:hypothetical protein N7495_003775 [Penicillium taxi]|uniref:uncharacterized protein n=1 Tax=Penicillium taxi TaxID=168475 RepID=UPI0025454E2F|nr:uncharacterized protein N7495_003775 [Penicillium taxi]KAJ5899031.1 hypothetical protein N7495_003775 [Penicillium taxi]
MATTVSYDGINSAFQLGVNNGSVTYTQFVQSETLNQACLRDLRTTNPYDDKNRIIETNGGLLKDSYRWILDNEEFKRWQDSPSHRLLWIRGDPGKGKTMLLCGIIEELARIHGDTTKISFFFCQATDMRINSATSVLRGLIYLLVENNPSLLSHVRARYDQAGKDLFDDRNAWNALTTIFMDILEDTSLKCMYLVIDALDECTSGLRCLLDFIIQASSAHSQIKWIISSRNWLEIIERLEIATQIAPISLELNEASVSEAVNKFIQYKVDSLAKIKRYKDDTRDAIYRYLSLNSQGTFLWVALVCQNLERALSRQAVKKLKTFPLGLNALYGRMIDQVHKSEDAELCKEVLAIMVAVYRPITLSELPLLLEASDDDYDDQESLSEIIAICGSFLTLRGDTILFVHQSAKDFLLQEVQNELFPIDIEGIHHSIFKSSLEVMFKTLRRDMFNIKSPGVTIKDIRQPSPNPLAATQYAYIYWIDHLKDSKHSETDDLSQVDAFLQQKFLYWLEALSILRSVSYGIQAMEKLKMIIQEKGRSQALLDRAEDASRFIRYNRTGIENTPLQVYCSPLIFSPTESLTRISFQKERPGWILNNPVVEKSWSLCLQTLEGHSDSVLSIAWSPDGTRLASGSMDDTVRIWDLATGQSVSTLEGHRGLVRSIAWSPDGTRLASGSMDDTVRIWDLATGQSVSTLEGHRGLVRSIAWSPDGTRLASGSIDNTVRIWDPATGQSVSTLEGHSDSVESIAWSPDGTRLASGSYDNTVRIWDPATGQSVSTLEGHSDSVSSIAWSPDGTRLASGSSDNTVRIWDPATGQSVSTLEGHSNRVLSIAWSPDGTRLASGSYDNTVRIWDPATGQSVSTLEGHSDWVSSIAWSPDGTRLASGSSDNTVRIWDPATGQSVSTLEGHSDWVSSIAWSPDGTRLASGSSDNTVRIWDPATGQSVSTLEGHSNRVLSIAWSPDGTRLASGSDDNTVRIWDPATGQSVSTLEGHSNRVLSIAWSPDGTRLASGSDDNTVRIWDPATGQSVSTLEGHSDSVESIAWSPDGTRLASGSYDNTVRIWDPATGQSVSTLEGHSNRVLSIAWSPDGTRLASGSIDNTVRIWDPATGQSVSTLEGHRGLVRSIAWSPDGTRLASGSNDNTVRIWDPATGKSVSTLNTGSTSFLQFDNFDFNVLHTSFGAFDTEKQYRLDANINDLASQVRKGQVGLDKRQDNLEGRQDDIEEKYDVFSIDVQDQIEDEVNDKLGLFKEGLQNVSQVLQDAIREF